MGQEPGSTFFSHVKPGDTPYKGGGLRDFFLYRDLGIAGATNGKVIAHLVKANLPPTNGTARSNCCVPSAMNCTTISGQLAAAIKAPRLSDAFRAGGCGIELIDCTLCGILLLQCPHL